MCFEVGLTAYEVDNFSALRILKESVNGEVTSLCVFFGGGEGDGFGVASVFVGAIVTEGGYFERELAFFDEDDAKVGTNGIGAGEERHDLVRGGGGSEIVVLGLDA